MLVLTLRNSTGLGLLPPLRRCGPVARPRKELPVADAQPSLWEPRGFESWTGLRVVLSPELSVLEHRRVSFCVSLNECYGSMAPEPGQGVRCGGGGDLAPHRASGAAL